MTTSGATVQTLETLFLWWRGMGGGGYVEHVRSRLQRLFRLSPVCVCVCLCFSGYVFACLIL